MNIGCDQVSHSKGCSSCLQTVERLLKLWETGVEVDHGAEIAVASAELGSYFSHDGWMWN